MIKTIALVLVCVLTLMLVLSPTLRRVLSAGGLVLKYLLLRLLDWLRIRPLVLRLLGRPSAKLTRPRALRRLAEDLGPTFVKLGQVVASSDGLFPPAYVEEFGCCLDSVRPLKFSQVRSVLRREMGPQWRKKIPNLAREPLASASIAQVHDAILADGTAVVVKVRRPNIVAGIRADIRIMRLGAKLASRFSQHARLANLVGIVEDLAKNLACELDFVLEAENLVRFNEIMSELGRDRVRAPVPHMDLTTRQVLVMEKLEGCRVDAIETIRSRGIDGETLLVEGMRAWFQSALLYGFFHGDVHAGNLMFLDSGEVGFLDFGIVGRLEEHQRRQLADYMIAMATGDYQRLGEVIVEMEAVPKSVDLDAFAEDLETAYGPLLTMALSEVSYRDLFAQVRAVSARHQMVLKEEFVLLTKQMLYFDRYAKLLAPGLNMFRDPRLILGLVDDLSKAKRAAS